MKIWQKLKLKRMEANLSQTEVANELHVSHQAISNWENNKSMPDLESLKSLSRIYHCSPSDFLEAEGKYSPPRDDSNVEIEPNSFLSKESNKGLPKINIYRAADPRLQTSLKIIPFDSNYFSNLPTNLVVRYENISIKHSYVKPNIQLAKKMFIKSGSIDHIELTGATIENCKKSLRLQTITPIIAIYLLGEACENFNDFINNEKNLSKKLIVLNPLEIQAFPQRLSNGQLHGSTIRLEVHYLNTRSLHTIEYKSDPHNHT